MNRASEPHLLPQLKNIKSLRPPTWARGGHSQTILAHLIPSPTVNFPLEEKIVTLKDGDRIKVYVQPGRLPVMVSVFHGLGGDIHADYMQRTANLARSLGYGVVLVNHRGADTGIGLARNVYHSGKGEDASDVFEWIKREYPHHFNLGIGVSMSGSILLNLISGRRGQVKPDAVITVNAPLDLAKGASKLTKGLNRIYDFRFVRRLDRQLKQKYRLGLMDKTYKIPLWASVYDFDRIFTGPATEFGTRENYYSSCSVKDHLSKVDVPCIMLTAQDDPFVDFADYLSSPMSSSIQIHVESSGGHVGYLGWEPQSGRSYYRWLDYFLKEAMHSLVKI